MYLNFYWNDGYGYASQMEGYQATNGQWAAIQGDSGGPVLVPYGNGSVGAAGMIQAVAGTLYNNGNCGSVRDGGGRISAVDTFGSPLPARLRTAWE